MEKKRDKEIHKTEYIDKELPSIYTEKTSQTGSTSWKTEIIRISDKSTEKALKTLKEIRRLNGNSNEKTK